MFKKICVLGVLLMIVAGLAACGTSGGEGASTGDGSATTTAAGASTAGTIVRLNDDYADALPVASQLAIGTLTLEGTETAVTVEQAADLLPNWQMLQALQSSGTAAQAELNVVVDQIQEAMTNEQVTTIRGMQLTLDSMMELVQEQGLAGGLKRGTGSAGRSATVLPPAGVDTGGAGGRGGELGALGGGEDLSPEEQEAAMEERMNALAGTAMTGMVVSMLEARAEGETWEVTAPNQDFELQLALVEAVAEATGLDEQAITAQTREGVTLLEITGAHEASLDEILAQIVAAETERVNQAVADGSLEQADADQWLAGLEAKAKEMLEGTLQFGGRGAPGS